jgi:hypothetical protein
MLSKNPITGRLEMVPDPKFIPRELNPISVDPDSAPFHALLAEKKVYIVKISQAGTAAPTVEILKDTLTGVVLARTSAGNYTLTKAGAFTANKTRPEKDNYTDADGNYYKITRTSADVMTLETFAAADTETHADGILNNQDLTIEIYA